MGLISMFKSFVNGCKEESARLVKEKEEHEKACEERIQTLAELNKEIQELVKDMDGFINWSNSRKRID